ncbi:DUF1489 family protein [Pseudohoeflea coraliihabitans]|uniref:DUF1489 domain-containing protein n=1 Tax=Pseudohoeflea coraliihabitans TaxID=2860393 RepID=A0ABS6WRF6_9HYPH|nr:DUF1489 domain-containing protein [Pseudohoeflea sp. DP4N28-3]MBW3098516.1 DUF1489 domain-containing protein [Pseudohoeflea sp. DP4N28-3]
MPLHLIKLCVGVETLEDLQAAIARRQAGGGDRYVHTTRMQPKRSADLIDGGSLYWVIKGNVQARQRLLAVEPFTDMQGTGRCRLVLEPVLHATRWQPRRPFQGWRYLKPEDAPGDLGTSDGSDELPAALRGELASLGLL